MTRPEYDQWSEDYAAMFGMTADWHLPTFDAWFRCFAACGYTRPDLDAATVAVAQSPPKRREDHLAAIHAAVRDRRAVARRQLHDPAEADDRGTCAVCGDSGAAVVPHPRALAAGQWVEGLEGTTCAAACHCGRGRAWADAWDCYTPEQKKRIPQPMTLTYYEGRVARHWRRLVADAEAQRDAHRKAVKVSRAADAEAGPLAGVVRRLVDDAGAA